MDGPSASRESDLYVLITGADELSASGTEAVGLLNRVGLPRLESGQRLGTRSSVEIKSQAMTQWS